MRNIDKYFFTHVYEKTTGAQPYNQNKKKPLSIFVMTLSGQLKKFENVTLKISFRWYTAHDWKHRKTVIEIYSRKFIHSVTYRFVNLISKNILMFLIKNM